MKPRRSSLVPRVDGLEARMVLTAPPGLVTTLVATPDVPGTIKLVLTETNTTDQDIPVNDGLGLADFWLTQGDQELWRYHRDEPQNRGVIRSGVPLPAGTSRSFVYLWPSHLRRGAALDPAQLLNWHGFVDDLGADATSGPPTPGTGSGSGSSGGVSTTTSSPSLSVAIQADRASYRQGRPVVLTITETNTSTRPIAVRAAGFESLTVARGGLTVWKNQAARLINAAATTALAPGQSRTFQVIWTGAFNQNTRQPRAGDFVATVQLDGLKATVSLTIRRR